MRNYLVVACLLFSAGCASTSTFSSYTSQSAPFIQRMCTGTPIDLNKELVQQINSADKILYLMERGRIAQIQGDFDTSRGSYDAAINAIKINDEKALISASGAGAQASAVLLNDNTIPYKGDGYERVMLYHFQAIIIKIGVNSLFMVEYPRSVKASPVFIDFYNLISPIAIRKVYAKKIKGGMSWLCPSCDSQGELSSGRSGKG